VVGAVKECRIGKCIYCGATEGLSREHIVPFALNGSKVLQEASCAACAAITSSFERRVLRDSLGPARDILNINSRKKKGRQTHYPMRMERRGKTFIENVPLDEYIPLLPVLVLGLPGYLGDSRRHQVGDGTVNATMIGKAMIRSESHVDELLKKYNTTQVTVKYNFHPVDFGRMLAKIAYCLAVRQFGLSGITVNYVLPAILGQSDDLWHFVGCDLTYPYNAISMEKIDALIWVDMDIIQGDVQARLRILPQANTPAYVVVVGGAREGLQGLFQGLGRRLS
jgi:hypothetical protein